MHHKNPKHIHGAIMHAKHLSPLSIRAQVYKGGHLQHRKPTHVEQPIEVPGLEMRCPMKVPPPKLASTAVMCKASTHNDQRRTSGKKQLQLEALVSLAFQNHCSTWEAPIGKIFVIK